MPEILITGGSGLIGRQLSCQLKELGYSVSWLSTSEKSNPEFRTYQWDPANGAIDNQAVADADYLIHLAGANIGQKRWSDARKREIVNSRVKTGELLFKAWQQNPGRLKAFISASASGYYGAVTSEKIYRESDPPADDFLGSICRQWEAVAGHFERSGVRTVLLRTGVVLTPAGGALQKILMPAKAGIGVVFGNGKQYLPWIHISDLCAMYVKAITDEQMKGAYNAVAPSHLTNLELTRQIVKILRLPFGLIKTPAWALQIAMGEMACIVLEGSPLSGQKIMDSGFKFRFPDISEALAGLLGKRAG